MSTVVVDGRLGIDAVVDGRPGIDIVLDGEFDKVIKVTEHAMPVYTGATEVTPNFDEQILQTQNKTMLNDVTVHAIPVDQAINASSGYTVTIGGI